MHKLYLSKCSKLKKLPHLLANWRFCKSWSCHIVLNWRSHLHLSTNWWLCKSWICYGVFSIEGGTYIYWPIHGFAKVELYKFFEVKELSTYVDRLMILQELYLFRCSKLKELPTSTNQLMALEKLNLSRFSKLTKLPTSIDQLMALKKLNLS